MELNPFRIEHYYAKYEFTAKYMLSNSDAQSWTIGELLALEPDAVERFHAERCGYTESPGSPSLREAVAGIYQRVSPDDVLVLSSAEEGIFVLYHTLVGPGDHVIVETPCYESALEVARSTGAAVSQWHRRYEDRWEHDIGALEKLVRPNTRIVYINTPHNPTGLIMPRPVFDRVIEIAREQQAVLFCDEVYRELEHDPATRLPAACDLYERAVSLGSVSKTYGLPGLRLGWYASRMRDLLERTLAMKYYTSICSSAPSEFLSALALRHRETLARRNRDIVRRNLPVLEQFFRDHGSLFEWVRPNASPIGFPRVAVDRDVLTFCEDVVRETSVLLLPGTVYDEPGHVRVGYGRDNMPEALARFHEYLERQSEPAR